MTQGEHGKACRQALRNILIGTLLMLSVASTAQPRTLQVRLDGQDTLVDVFAPVNRNALDSVHDAVILAHGFTRDRSTMTGHASALAADGYWVIVPDLPYLMDSRDNALVLRELLQRLQHDLVGARLDRFVLVGFSAGGLSALLAADSPGVVAYVGLDPFDRPGGVGLAAARKLQRPAYLLRGPGAACNAFSIAEPWVQALPRLVVDRQLAQASHCDFEAPTDRLCQFVCGDTTAANQSIVRSFLREAVAESMPPPSGPGDVPRPAQRKVHEMPDQAQQQP
jgi:pimeloyl-ACP methyl ester carboxylesterase